MERYWDRTIQSDPASKINATEASGHTDLNSTINSIQTEGVADALRTLCGFLMIEDPTEQQERDQGFVLRALKSAISPQTSDSTPSHAEGGARTASPSPESSRVSRPGGAIQTARRSPKIARPLRRVTQKINSTRRSDDGKAE